MSNSSLIAHRYELINQIGRGGMGQVWEARDTRLQRDVAIKTVDLSSVADASTGERFRREAVATARLSHPNIVTVFDAGVDGDTAFLVMELLRGESLAQIVRERGALPLADGLPISQSVARALVAAHAIGIVHRDIKPANVMVQDQVVKLLDFGIARLMHQVEAALTGPANTIGTAAYMAPEQAAGQVVTPATDMYAFGCLLTTIFTGQPPFVSESQLGVATQQLTAIPPRISQRRGGLPPALDQLVDELLAKDPGRRPDAGDTLAALNRIERNPGATVPLPAAGAGTAAVGPPTTAVLPMGSQTPNVVTPPTGPSATSVMPAAPPRATTVLPGRDPAPERHRKGGWGKWLAVAAVVVVLGLIMGVLLGGWLGDNTALLPPSIDPSSRITSAKPRTTTPTQSATQPTSPTTTRTRTTTRPSNQPTPADVALRTALAGVRTSISAISGTSSKSQKAKQQLLSSWDKATEDVMDDHSTKRLDAFETSVDKYASDESITLIEQQTIKLSVSLVRALL